MTSKDKAKKHLVSLGNTVASIAAKLKAAKIKGNRSDYEACPIAIWLSKKMPTCRIGIVDTVFDIDDGSCCCNEGKLPPAVRRFVKNFDAGKYPYLESP